MMQFGLRLGELCALLMTLGPLVALLSPGIRGGPSALYPALVCACLLAGIVLQVLATDSLAFSLDMHDSSSDFGGRGPIQGEPGTSANLIIGNTNCPWCPGNGPDWGPATAGIDLQTAFYPESGIPTFRDPGGILDQFDAEELGTGAGLLRTLAWVTSGAPVEILTGMGVTGINNPVNWGVDIVTFVFWVGIGHAGTLISAILLVWLVVLVLVYRSAQHEVEEVFDADLARMALDLADERGRDPAFARDVQLGAQLGVVVHQDRDAIVRAEHVALLRIGHVDRRHVAATELQDDDVRLESEEGADRDAPRQGNLAPHRLRSAVVSKSSSNMMSRPRHSGIVNAAMRVLHADDDDSA